MQNNPQVSVVMSVYNGADSLPRTIESILAQENVDFEFIVVNDGSKDNSGKILDTYAQGDPRLRIIHQENSGLTKALIRGCAEAKGEFIARQDAGGDISYPRRLVSQLEQLQRESNAVFTSCGTRYVDPEHEILYEVQMTQAELNEGLHEDSLEKLKGPSHHGSVMFRRSIYEFVGGYRSAYKVAQDLDLWIRMSECGLCLTTEEILYEAVWISNGISSRQRPQQAIAAKAVLDCAIHRQRKLSEDDILNKLTEDLKKSKFRLDNSKLLEANAWYFMGACALNYSRDRARRHFLQAIKCYPFHVKAFLRLILQ
ncbi:glycosyltransferase family 2 protein [Dolichospermum sp. UHCC 0259]|uniref:glycosyltransferase family 2 protein n=1 Tax=Dolichospermum sp. UHCC 0259 TaxID=2590010 RepID=UPI001445CC09|nr:glycosyltransferase family 2 protein [Dolichospermum sp. UHCC 0259]MTJ50321.1 glycosyltransferase family 2 protein [Dolichospermum sp. UHCC 0259]